MWRPDDGPPSADPAPTAAEPDDGDTRRFFEYTRSMPGAFVPPYGASDSAALEAFDRATIDADRRIREIAGRQLDAPVMPDFSALRPAIEATAVSMLRAVATFCNAVKHDMKHVSRNPWFDLVPGIQVDPSYGSGPDADLEPNGIRVA